MADIDDALERQRRKLQGRGCAIGLLIAAIAVMVVLERGL